MGFRVNGDIYIHMKKKIDAVSSAVCYLGGAIFGLLPQDGRV